MFESIETLRRVLWIILGSGLAALGLVFGGLIFSRLTRTLQAGRRTAIEARYLPLVDGLLLPATARGALDALQATPSAHHDLIGGLLLRPLRVARGEIVGSIRAAAETLGQDRRWLGGLDDRRWWVRAESARALGLIRSPDALPWLTQALEDDSEEVRAAAVESLGLLGDVRAIPALLAGLAHGSRQQRVRVIEALRLLGPAATPGLLEHAVAAPGDRRVVASVLGQIGGADALPTLIEWMSDTDSAVRAAALEAAGTLGIDDRAHYFVLRALQDETPDVRAMAARALARSPRQGIARYLEPRLDDAWDVAVQSAIALRRLGPEGLAVLERLAGGEGQAAQLAGQILWERRSMPGPREPDRHS